MQTHEAQEQHEQARPVQEQRQARAVQEQQHQHQHQHQQPPDTAPQLELARGAERAAQEAMGQAHAAQESRTASRPWLSRKRDN